MKTPIKTLLLTAGLLGVGTILAQGFAGHGYGFGPDYEGYYRSDNSPLYQSPYRGHGMMGRHMIGGAGFQDDWNNVDVDTNLQKIHDALGITATQEAAWHDYVNAVKVHQNTISKLNSRDATAFTAGPDDRYLAPHEVMWKSRDQVLKATDALYSQLNPAQRLHADRVLGFGHHM